MKYKRAAEEPTEEIDPSMLRSDEAEVVAPSDPPVVAVGAQDTMLEEVFCA